MSMTTSPWAKLRLACLVAPKPNEAVGPGAEAVALG